jgi:hypothetical protein
MAGQQKSSLNHYKHGIYVKQLYPTAAQWETDGADYQRLALGIRDHYRPTNYMSEMCVEILAVYHVFLARITGQLQSYLTSEYAFAGPMADRIIRNRSSIEQAISGQLRKLDRFQAKEQGASGERRETGMNPWVESAEVIYQGPPKLPGPCSNDGVDAKAGAPSDAQSGESNSTANFGDSVKTVVPKRDENTPTDSFARLLREAVGEPYPNDRERAAAASESVKKKPTGE